MIWVYIVPWAADTLLRPCIRRSTIFISAWWVRTQTKLSREKFEEIQKKIQLLETRKQIRISPNTNYFSQLKVNWSSNN